MALIRSSEHFQPHVPSLVKSIQYDAFSTLIDQAENDFIRPVLGKAFLDELNTALSGTPSADQDALINVIRRPLANYAALNAVSFMNVQFSGGGIVVSQSQTQTPASQYRIEELKASLKKLAYSSLESLLIYLEENKALFPTWSGSSYYTITRECFVNSAVEFNNYLDIQNSRWLFIRMKPIMQRVEDTLLKGVLGKNFYQVLKAQILADGVLSGSNLNLKPFIWRAITHLTLSEAVTQLGLSIDDFGVSVFSNEQAETINVRKPAEDSKIAAFQKSLNNIGQEQLKLLEKYLNDNASSFPVFEADSTVYKPSEDSHFENESGTGFYMT